MGGVAITSISAQLVYDYLHQVQAVKDPCALKLGDDYFMGEWVSIAQWTDERGTKAMLIVRSRERAILVKGKGKSWESCIRNAGYIDSFISWVQGTL